MDAITCNSCGRVNPSVSHTAICKSTPHDRLRDDAGARLRRAVRLGLIERKPCETCGAVAEAHHEDYYKPLDVRWLCKRHHEGVHHLLQK